MKSFFFSYQYGHKDYTNHPCNKHILLTVDTLILSNSICVVMYYHVIFAYTSKNTKLLCRSAKICYVRILYVCTVYV